MKIRILKDLPRTIDGQKIGPFRAGQELEMDDAHAALFIGSAMAEEVLPEPVIVEEIAQTDAAENTEEAPRSRRKKAE